MNMFVNEISLLTANVMLYKWLLGGGIVLMALLGLVFFGMLAMQVLQQEDAPAAPAEESAEPPAEEEPTADAAEEQEG